MELREKERRRYVMCLRVAVDIQNGMNDEEIEKKYTI